SASELQRATEDIVVAPRRRSSSASRRLRSSGIVAGAGIGFVAVVAFVLWWQSLPGADSKLAQANDEVRAASTRAIDADHAAIEAEKPTEVKADPSSTDVVAQGTSDRHANGSPEGVVVANDARATGSTETSSDVRPETEAG